MSDLWYVLATAIGGAIAGAATLWQIIRKTGPEVHKVEAETAGTTVRDVYEPIIDRLQADVEALRAACIADKAALEAQLGDMRATLSESRGALTRLQDRFDDLVEGEVLRQTVREVLAELDRATDAEPDGPTPVVVVQPEGKPVPVRDEPDDA